MSFSNIVGFTGTPWREEPQTHNEQFDPNEFLQGGGMAGETGVQTPTLLSIETYNYLVQTIDGMGAGTSFNAVIPPIVNPHIHTNNQLTQLASNVFDYPMGNIGNLPVSEKMEKPLR